MGKMWRGEGGLLARLGLTHAKQVNYRSEGSRGHLHVRFAGSVLLCFRAGENFRLILVTCYYRKVRLVHLDDQSENLNRVT